ALPVGTGLQVMQQLMEADDSAACGLKGKHDAALIAVRHGTDAGSVSLGGRRLSVHQPRRRTAHDAAPRGRCPALSCCPLPRYSAASLPWSSRMMRPRAVNAPGFIANAGQAPW